ncbi:MAG: hypothetical protein O3A93_10255 [Chloroflexi bacterium]|nr:hypothetical protein [Chloroflexota bacterium]MDA1271625.1 hypothetical protein [Chloroflexota bacterium]
MTAPRRIPIPVAFFLVLAAVLALIIFFGAWAVAADVGNQRTLAFGLPGTTPGLNGSNIRETEDSAFQVARLDGEGTAGDTWWGGAFLRACPLH